MTELRYTVGPAPETDDELEPKRLSRADWDKAWKALMDAHMKGEAVIFEVGSERADRVVGYKLKNAMVARARTAGLRLHYRYVSKEGKLTMWLRGWRINEGAREAAVEAVAAILGQQQQHKSTVVEAEGIGAPIHPMSQEEMAKGWELLKKYGRKPDGSYGRMEDTTDANG